MTEKRPNVLIVMTDHQRGDTVLPEHPARMPHVKRLTREGITFRETYCPSPHCCPSRATFHTGLYPSGHGVWNNICNGQALSRGVKDGVRLWSEDLVATGYRMLFSGKWHVSTVDTPKDRGWQELRVTGYKAGEHGTPWRRYQEVAASPAAERGEGGIVRPGYPPYRLYGTREEGNPGDEESTALAVSALDELGRGDDPWCLFVGLTGPHDPYCVPSRYLDLYDLADVPLPPSYADDLADKPRIYQRLRRQVWGQLDEREVREAIRHFWAYCTYLDDLFGRVLAALERTGQADDTLMLFTSDHGDYCGDHGLFAKGIAAFEGAYHVPAIMRWPNGIKNTGRSVDEFVSLADFGPTFLDLVGCRPERAFTGASLAPFLRGETPADWRDEMHTQCNGVELYYTQRSVKTKEWKYVFNGFDDDELYDLRRDPHEMRNLAANARYDAVKQAMCRRLWRFALREGDTATNAYITVGLAPFGPAEAFSEEER